jgi:hypothetical protein
MAFLPSRSDTTLRLPNYSPVLHSSSSLTSFCSWRYYSAARPSLIQYIILFSFKYRSSQPQRIVPYSVDFYYPHSSYYYVHLPPSDTVSTPQSTAAHASIASAQTVCKIVQECSSYSGAYVSYHHYIAYSMESLLRDRVAGGSILGVRVAGWVKAGTKNRLGMWVWDRSTVYGDSVSWELDM